MAAGMHAKSDSEVTSMETSSPPRSPRRAMYYVQSPSQHDTEKMSYGSSPLASPPHQYQYPNYLCSPVHHSRESSTSRFSSTLKNPLAHIAPWKKLPQNPDLEDADVDGGLHDPAHRKKFYMLCFLVSFTLLFTTFSLILWAASTAYKPRVVVENIVFHDFFIQSGMDNFGVPTDMMSLNSTVRIWYRNPSTFFGVHVTSTPFDLHYYQLKVASGQLTKFYQSRKSQRVVPVVVGSSQVPLYGGLSSFSTSKGHQSSLVVPLNLTFTVRSRAFVLGKLVKPKFYRTISCSLTLRSTQLGKRHNFTNSCVYG